MRRFFNDDNEPDHFNFGDDDDQEEQWNEIEDAIAYIEGSADLIDMLKVNIDETKLNQHLLSKAIKVAESNFFWRFKSNFKKMEEIDVIYHTFLDMIDSKPEGE